VSPYLSLRARLADFARHDLDALMWDSWRLVRFRAMRGTMFVLPHDLLEIAAAATRHLTEPLAARWLRDSGLSAAEFARLTDAVAAALADGPLTVRQLRRVLEVPPEIDLPGVVGRMCDLGRLVGGAPPRDWRSSVRRYHRWEDVVDGVDLEHWDEAAAIRRLVGHYLRSYGPATIDDISWWTGIAKGRCRDALEAEAAAIEEVAVDGWRGPLLRRRRDGAVQAPGEDVAALPLLDPYVQGYRDRGRFLDPERAGYVYDRGGNAAATLVLRGRIIGVWQFVDDPEASVRYYLFAPSPVAVRRGAEAALAAAGALYFERDVDVAAAATMEPLHAGGGRSAAHPLDGRIQGASRRRRTGGG
jgi:hypothetical protein